MRVLDRKLLRDLWRIRGQALAIVMVIASGTALSVMSFGTIQSLEETRAAYYERYRFADIFAGVKRAPETLAARIADIPGVRRVQTRIVADVSLDVPGMDEPVAGRLISIPERGHPVLNDLRLRRGRWVEAGRVDEVVVSEPFARAHGLDPGDRFHAIINGRKRALQITGIALSPEYILSGSAGASVPDDRRFGVMWMGHEALAAAYDLDGAFNSVTVSLLRGASEKEAIERIDDLLRAYGGVGAYGRKDQVSHSSLDNDMGQVRAISRLGIPIFVGIIAFLLNMVMSRLIDTEREQIGLLKAFGYTDGAVFAHYLKLVLVVAGLGVVLGCAAGVWFGLGLMEMYGRFYHFPFLAYRLTPGVFLISAAIHLAAAVIGPLGSLHRAARLPPAVAMAPAPPPVYRRTLIERIGLSLLTDTPTRMIVRHIVRWPLRSALTTLGISASVAILVGLVGIYDAFDRVVDWAFFQSQRQDAMVSFVEPKSRHVVFDLGHLPGVQAVEPFRSVPARVRFKHRERRISVLGTEPGGDLSLAFDRNNRVIPPPANGIAVSGALAELLEARIGDRLTIEVMEGRRPVVDLPIVAVIADYFGLNVRMERAALNRLMGEGPAVSGAWLRVDAAREGDFYRALKATPAVAGVNLRRSELGTLRATLQENTRMVFFYVLFSCIIAFGVVYNSARIALSERGRELASLRVLGFTRFEVSYILLGELAVLTLIALPLGCVLGYGLASVLITAFSNEQFRVAPAIDPSTYGLGLVVVVAATIISALLVRRRIDRLDLVEVLKTRE
jgi:putative ABC transport system permease protein